MCWSDPIWIFFNHEERSSLDLLNMRKRCLWIFFFMLCVWHTLRSFVIDKSLVIICVCMYLFIYFYSCLVTSWLRGWLSRAIYLAIYWLFLADPAAVYVTKCYWRMHGKKNSTKIYSPYTATDVRNNGTVFACWGNVLDTSDLFNITPFKE